MLISCVKVYKLLITYTKDVEKNEKWLENFKKKVNKKYEKVNKKRRRNKY